MNKIKERKPIDYILSALVMVSFFILFLFIDDILVALTPFTFVNAFIITFISIILEALPFLLVGCIVSAIWEVYISDSTIARFIPENKFLGIIVTSLLGILFPVCEYQDTEKLNMDTWVRVSGTLDISSYYDNNRKNVKIPKIIVGKITTIDPPAKKYIFAH